MFVTKKIIGVFERRKNMSEKVELNKIFEVKKGKITSRWKVIKHPYFEDCLTLVKDYCGKYGEMKNGECEEDYNHMKIVKR